MSESRLYPARPFVAASAAVLREGRVLVAARAMPPLREVFSLPGGLVEAGETLAEAALRELEEETGLKADLIAALPPIDYVERDEAGAVRHHFVICPQAVAWRFGEPKTGPEALAFRWLALDEVDSVPTTPGLGPVLRQALALASPRMSPAALTSS